jgi:hypothetical protein
MIGREKPPFRDLPAGSDLDALVAERVMDASLTPPREYAMARVGLRYVRATGQPFILRDGTEVEVPPGASLRQPEGTTNWNDRYFHYIAKLLGDKVQAEVAAYRLPAPEYSTDLAAAWAVLEKVSGDWQIHGGGVISVVLLEDARDYKGVKVIADSLPLAICRAALEAVN